MVSIQPFFEVVVNFQAVPPWYDFSNTIKGLRHCE
jgi:hypothetical protein